MAPSLQKPALQTTTRDEWRKKLVDGTTRDAQNYDISLNAIGIIKTHVDNNLTLLFPADKGNMPKQISNYVATYSRPVEPKLNSKLIVDMMDFGTQLTANGVPYGPQFLESAQRAAIARTQVPAGDSFDTIEKSLKFKKQEAAFVLSLEKRRLTATSA